MDEAGTPQSPQRESLEARVLRLEGEVARLRVELERVRVGGAQGVRLGNGSDGREVVPPSPLQPAALPVDAVGFGSASAAGPASEVALPVFGGARTVREVSLEDRLGSQWFNRIGIVLLLLGTSWFLKLAVDRGWIVPSPTARVIAGLVAGAGLVLWSERFRRKGFPAFSYSLKALGSGVLYLTLWAGFRMYGLLPAPVALLLMVGVTAWNAFMAWSQDAQLLAVYALAGGFATPLLLSAGGNHEVSLFTYLAAMDAAAVALVRLKRWPRLLVGAFPVTAAYFVSWYVQWWWAKALWVTAAFVALFGVVFGSVAVGKGAGEARVGRRSTVLEEILAPLLNAAFVGLALYSVLQDSGHHGWLPWMVLVLAGVYLGVIRLPQTKIAGSIHLSIAVVFLTIAIPLKASGHWITAGWLVEGLALAWVSARLGEGDAEAYAAGVLRWLGLGALGLGFCGIAVHLLPPDERAGLWTGNTATALLGVGVFAGVAWLAGTRGKAAGWREVLIAGLVGVDGVAVLLALREVMFSWGAPRAPLLSAAFGSAVLGLLVFVGVSAVAVREMRVEGADAFWPTVAGVSVVLFNLTAVLTGVREVSAIWGGAVGTDVDAALKQGLAISAYLMAYGAGLLAAGFWKRSAFLRWQGLGLLLFTIVKTFAWDMRNLSQGYRVVSFLGLGGLLMAVSYAYQKDWLALRVSDETARDREPGAE